jgi:hypothetical protein
MEFSEKAVDSILRVCAVQVSIVVEKLIDADIPSTSSTLSSKVADGLVCLIVEHVLGVVEGTPDNLELHKSHQER